MDTRQLRFCISIDCKHLDKGKCEEKECKYLDKQKAVKEKWEREKEVKHGGNS